MPVSLDDNDMDWYEVRFAGLLWDVGGGINRPCSDWESLPDGSDMAPPVLGDPPSDLSVVS